MWQMHKIYSTEKACLKALFYLIDADIECRCNHSKGFYNGKNYTKSCISCKRRYRPTYNTLFHNVRFGLPKAIHLYLEVRQGTELSSIKLAQKYRLRQGTVSKFIRKIKADPHPHLLELLLETRTKEELKNTIALKKFLQQIK